MKSSWWILIGIIGGGLFLFGFFSYSGRPLRVLATLDQPKTQTTPSPQTKPQNENAPQAKPAPKKPKAPLCEDPYKVICSNPKGGVDPSGKVGLGFKGEMMALRYLRRIVRQYPDWTSEQVEAELVKEIYTVERIAWVKAVFSEAVIRLKELIVSQSDSVFSTEERDRLVKHLDKVELHLPPPASVYSDARDLFTKNDVFYQRSPDGKVFLRVGGAYLLNTTSDFNGVFTFAHEIAHSIDPCELKMQLIEPRIYTSLKQCFIEKNWLPKERSECGANELVSEVFADWAATQVVMNKLKNDTDYSKRDKQLAAINSVRDLCEHNIAVDTLVFTHHPPPEVRIGQIFGGHPYARNILNCKIESESYCELDTLRVTQEEVQE